MTLAKLLPIAINVSIGLIVIGLGMHARFADVTYLVRRPGLLLRSLLAMNVIMLFVAAGAAILLDLDPAVKIAIVTLALSPVPPLLPTKQAQAGGSVSYITGLLVTAAALSIVVAPAGFVAIDRLFGGTGAAPPGKVAPVVLIGVIGPLLLGVLVNYLAPEFAKRIAPHISRVGTVLLVVAVVPILISQWHHIIDVLGNGTGLTLALFTVIGVAVGHLLGGPDPDDRTVLALATGTRHPGVALSIATAAFPTQTSVLAVVLWHLIIGGIVSGPYVKWRQRAHHPSRQTPSSQT
jgi:predicted Na+-dependent transporter